MVGNVFYTSLLIVLLLLSLIVFYVTYSNNQNFFSLMLFVLLICIYINSFDFFRVSYNFNKYKKDYEYVVNHIDEFKKEEDSSNSVLGEYDYLSRDGYVVNKDKLISFNIYNDEYLIYTKEYDDIEKIYNKKTDSIKKIDDNYYFVITK